MHELGVRLFIDFSDASEGVRTVQEIFDCKKGYRALKTLESKEYSCRLINRFDRKNPDKSMRWLVLEDDPMFGLPLHKAENFDRTGTIYVAKDLDGNAYFEN